MNGNTIEQATSENLTEPNWDLNVRVCDELGRVENGYGRNWLRLGYAYGGADTTATATQVKYGVVRPAPRTVRLCSYERLHKRTPPSQSTPLSYVLVPQAHWPWRSSDKMTTVRASLAVTLP